LRVGVLFGEAVELDAGEVAVGREVAEPVAYALAGETGEVPVVQVRGSVSARRSARVARLRRLRWSLRRLSGFCPMFCVRSG
jgi:hypothetical protein